MSLDISIARQPSAAGNDNAEQFLNEVQNGSAVEGDYPYAHVVTINGEVYIGFATGLPRSREPWHAGYVEFTRDTVLRADGLRLASEQEQALVNSILDDFVDLGDIDPLMAVGATDGGSDESEDGSDDLGELFG
jgi:hypothetical protein